MTEGKHPKITPTLNAYLLFTLIGAVTTAYGALLPHISKYFNTTPAEVGFRFFSYTLLSGIGTITSGFIVRKLQPLASVWLFGGLIAASCAALALVKDLNQFTIVLAFYGFGNGGLYSLCNLFIASSHRGKAKNKKTAILNFSYSLGAVLYPFVITWCLSEGFNWGEIYAIAAIPFILAMILCFFSNMKPLNPPHTEASSQNPTTQREERWRLSKPLFIASAFIAAYVLSEMLISQWIVTSLLESNKKIAEANFGLSLFWLGILIGRFISTFLSGRIKTKTYIIVTKLVAATSLILYLRLSFTDYASIFVFTTGLGLGPVFGLLFNLGTDTKEGANPHGIAFLTTASLIGMMISLPIGSTMRILFSGNSPLWVSFAMLVVMITFKIMVKTDSKLKQEPN